MQLQTMSAQGPQGANMIAEPAQLVVLVPGTKTGEQLLSKVKAYAMIASMVLLGLFILFVATSWRSRKKPASDYAGTTLPGAFVTAGEAPVAEAPVVKAPVVKEPVSKMAPTAPQMPEPEQEDIVRVTGIIPVWNLSDAVEPEQDEKRVTENDPTIQAIIKSREAMTKEIEAFQSSSMNN